MYSILSLTQLGVAGELNVCINRLNCVIPLLFTWIFIYIKSGFFCGNQTQIDLMSKRPWKDGK